MSAITLNRTITLPESVQDFIANGNYTRDAVIAGLLTDTKLAWIASGPHIDIIESKNGRKIAGWTFGAILKDASTKIVCIKELKTPFKEVTLLVIGLECMSNEGMICVFDISTWKVLRAIQIKDKVTSLHIISNGDETASFPGPLSNFDGALAVGTAGGEVLIIDLCREVIQEARQIGNNIDIKNEINPSQLIILSVNDVDNLEKHKEIAERNGNHLALHINAIIGENPPHFILKGPGGDDRIHANKEEVCVSALTYAPQLCSVFIGYNFGALQIWNLLHMNLIYTSSVHPDNIPISHFAIQEPVDDPKAFCYFWAVYSKTEQHQDTFPIAALYSLNYELKDWHEGYGYIYQNLKLCSVAFKADLGMIDSGECNDSIVGAQCIRLSAFSKNVPKDAGNSSCSLQGYQEDTYTLLGMVWNVWCKIHGFHTYLSIFDLNQWYKEQMPKEPYLDQYSKYMVNFSLTQNINTFSKVSPVLDAHINSASISMFLGSQKCEEYYYPASLAFDCFTINEVEIKHYKNLGSQRQLLKDLETMGPLALMKPTNVYKMSIKLGLTPIFMDSQESTHNLVHQREHLLSLALEYKMKNFLYKCAESWSNGCHRSAGLSLDLLLNWTWNRACMLKSNSDVLSVSLFNFSELKLDSNMNDLLNKCRGQILVLRDLYSYICKKCTHFLANPEITRQQWDCLKRIFAYLDIQGWMVNIGLLPECPNLDEGFNKEKLTIPYLSSKFEEYYKERRINLHILNQTAQLISGNCFLYIDKVIQMYGNQLIEMEWKQHGGNGDYPPRNLQGLLRIYLLENINIEQKHIIFTYLLLDLAKSLDEDRYKSIIPTLIKFPYIFQMPNSAIKIIQAFWHIDHGELETAVEHLIDPMIKSSQIESWQHKFILQLLMLQNSYKLAHLYLKVRQPPLNDVEDVTLAISLLIYNNMIREALKLSRQHRKKGNSCFTKVVFRECFKTDQIHELIACDMSRIEEEALFHFMDEIKYPEKDHFKATYYLQRARYLDLYNLQSLKKHSVNRMEDIHELNNVLAGLVPDVTKRVIDICLSNKDSCIENEQCPKPMSAFLHNNNEYKKYNSDFCTAAIFKAKETWSNKLNKNNVEGKRMLGEDFPFIKTPIAFPKHTRSERKIIYAKIVDNFDDFAPEEDETPRQKKRIKLFHRESIHTPNILVDESLHNLTTMDTPIIRSSTLKDGLQNTLDFTQTPQGILKIGKKNISSRGNTPTPENLQDIPDEHNDFHTINFEYFPQRSITGRRSLVRFSGVHSSSNSTIDSPVKPPELCSNNLIENSDTNIAQKLSNDSKNTSSDTEVFYSPESSGAGENVPEMFHENDNDLESKKLNTTRLSVSARKSFRAESPLVETVSESSNILNSPASCSKYFSDTNVSRRKVNFSASNLDKSDEKNQSIGEHKLTYPKSPQFKNKYISPDFISPVISCTKIFKIDKLRPIKPKKISLDELETEMEMDNVIGKEKKCVSHPSVGLKGRKSYQDNESGGSPKDKNQQLVVQEATKSPMFRPSYCSSDYSPQFTCTKILDLEKIRELKSKNQVKSFRKPSVEKEIENDLIVEEEKLEPSCSTDLKERNNYQDNKDGKQLINNDISCDKLEQSEKFVIPTIKISPEKDLKINKNASSNKTEEEKADTPTISLKGRKSYKEETTKIRSSPRFSRSRSPSTSKDLLHLNSPRKSLSQMVLENNARTKLLANLQAEDEVIMKETSVIQTEISKTTSDNLNEEKTETFESHDLSIILVEETKTIEKATTETSRTIKRIVQTEEPEIFEITDEEMEVEEISMPEHEKFPQDQIIIDASNETKEVITEDLLFAEIVTGTSNDVEDITEENCSEKIKVTEENSSSFEIPPDVDIYNFNPEELCRNDEAMADHTFMSHVYPNDVKSILNVGIDSSNEDVSSSNTNEISEVITVSSGSSEEDLNVCKMGSDISFIDDSIGSVDKKILIDKSTQVNIEIDRTQEKNISKESVQFDMGPLDKSVQVSFDDDIQGKKEKTPQIDKETQVSFNFGRKITRKSFKAEDFLLNELDKSLQISMDIEESINELDAVLILSPSKSVIERIDESKIDEPSTSSSKQDVNIAKDQQNNTTMDINKETPSQATDNDAIKPIEAHKDDAASIQVSGSTKKEKTSSNDKDINEEAASLKHEKEENLKQSENKEDNANITETIEERSVKKTPAKRRRSTSVTDVLTPTRRSLRSYNNTELRVEEVPLSPNSTEQLSSPKSSANRGTKRKSTSVLDPIKEKPKTDLKRKARAKSETIQTYSSSRRLTRRQKNLLEKNASLKSIPDSGDDEDVRDDIDSMDVLDRVDLLNKDDFKGEVDPDEEKMLQQSPVSSITGSSIAESVSKSRKIIDSEKSFDDAPSTPKSSVRSRRSVGTADTPIKTYLRRGRSASIDLKESTSEEQKQPRSKSVEVESPSEQKKPAPRRTRKTSQDSNVSNTSTTNQRSLRTRTKSENSGTESNSETGAVRTRNRRYGQNQTELSKIIEESSTHSEIEEPKKAKRKTKK